MSPQQLREATSSLDRDAHWTETRDKLVAEKAASKAASVKRPPVRPKTENQKAYWQAMRKSQITFCGGPPGTGKTLLSLATALQALREKLVDRIMIVRPTVTVGKEMGHMPGDLKDKMSVYVTAVTRHLKRMLDHVELAAFLKAGTITFEAAQFMRGESLDRAFIIVDEAQNLNKTEMKMLLTRIEGNETRMVLNGDEEQFDINCSYFTTALAKFKDRDRAIAVVRMEECDCMRSRIVKVVTQIMKEPD